MFGSALFLLSVIDSAEAIEGVAGRCFLTTVLAIATRASGTGLRLRRG